MKFRILTVMLLAVMILSGCNLAATEERLESAGEAVEDRVDMVEDAVENAVTNALSTTPTNTPAQTPSTQGTGAMLTPEEAKAIALEHAGFTADQVTFLRTKYEIDDGVPQYEVQFRQDRWEYDYDINAETGAILSYDRED